MGEHSPPRQKETPEQTFPPVCLSRKRRQVIFVESDSHIFTPNLSIGSIHLFDPPRSQPFTSIPPPRTKPYQTRNSNRKDHLYRIPLKQHLPHPPRAPAHPYALPPTAPSNQSHHRPTNPAMTSILSSVLLPQPHLHGPKLPPPRFSATVCTKRLFLSSANTSPCRLVVGTPASSST